MKYNKYLEELNKEIGFTPSHAQIGKICDKGQSTFNNLATRDGNIKQEYIDKINRFYGIEISEETTNDCVSLPVREDVEASMGYGAVVYNETQTATYSISKQLANDLGISVDSSEIIYGRGNSMEPTIIGGDALLIDKSKREVSDGRIYCIRYDGQLLTKRLQKLSRTKLKVISDNKDYEPITIDFEIEKDIDFEIIGEVRWAGRVFK